jgi:hypothetical protein
MWGPLVALLALMRSAAADTTRDLWVGHHYRFEGDLRSQGAVDVRKLLGEIRNTGARDVQIGERPPHRIAWTATMQASARVRLGQVFPLTPDGTSVVLRSVREIFAPEAVVGRRRA